MSQPHPELLILSIVLISLALAPLASRLIQRIGSEISSELDGGHTGEDLQRHLDRAYEMRGGGAEDDEIGQMIAARAFVRGEEAPPVADEVQRIVNAQRPADPLRDEVREIVIASAERRERLGWAPFDDIEAEVDRRLARYKDAE